MRPVSLRETIAESGKKFDSLSASLSRSERATEVAASGLLRKSARDTLPESAIFSGCHPGNTGWKPVPPRKHRLEAGATP